MISDLDSNQSRVDFLFVVSPTTITRQMMENRSAGTEPYFPYTYKRLEDCPDNDPDTSPTCQSNSIRKTTYDLWTTEIFVNAQPETTEVYPLCAIQAD